MQAGDLGMDTARDHAVPVEVSVPGADVAQIRDAAMAAETALGFDLGAVRVVAGRATVGAGDMAEASGIGPARIVIAAAQIAAPRHGGRDAVMDVEKAQGR